MDHREAPIFMVEPPVVNAADPFDAEGRTADLAGPLRRLASAPALSDRLVPGPGAAAWAGRFGAVLTRGGVLLLPVTALAALPMHFFVGRLDEAVIAAPYLSELAGGFGLLLLPIMWLAYLAVTALPHVITLAGAVGVLVPQAAGARLRPRLVWSLVALRLRALWLWFAAFSVLTGSLPLLLTEDSLGPAARVPLAVVLAAVSTAVLTFGGVLGCVVLIERGHARRRTVRLLARVQPVGLIAAAAAVTVVPQIADEFLGGLAATLAGVVLAQLWAIAALVTYAQARRLEEPVTSASLRNELAAPEE
ncbi:hypothetical protein [Actinoplanes sp. URMC 104]|uniref:hypothetical protein n=1 Tax=Actinoplanes sp. URMC 104 TaxID=3423409 RepID=UPI003F1BA2F3